MSFKEDRLENEKEDPKEASSFKYINLPLVLLALFIGFGVSYLAFKTENTDMTPGDSRTSVATDSPESSTPSDTQASAGEPDLEALLKKGKQVYTTTCQVCHQANGAGLAGVFPPLGKSDWVTGSEKRLVAILLHGLQGEIHVNGMKYQGVMPPFKGVLSSEEIAAVTTYVRRSFENEASPVGVEQVEEIKGTTSAKSGAWAGEGELNSQNWE